MKIGIYTQPLHINYGGILQAYALQTILQRMGHEVFVLKKDHKQQLPIIKWPYSYPKRLIKKYILKENSLIFYEQFLNKTYKIVGKNTLKFIDTYINNIPLKKLRDGNLDLIIVGSDQVWRPIYNKPIEQSFLDFTKNWNITRIAYAASFGTDKWEFNNKQTKKCKELIKNFKAVSVREFSGVRLCKTYFNIEAKHVLDPTMLLEKKDYMNLYINKNIPKSTGDLLVYILDESPQKTKLITTIAKNKNLTPFKVNSLVENLYAPIEQRVQPPVEEWLKGFEEAKLIITDSFHACVFSIIFNKPFIVYGNKSRGYSRFVSLLNDFNLNERLVTNEKEAIQLSDEIDWNNINKKWEHLKTLSLSFLEKNIL